MLSVLVAALVAGGPMKPELVLVTKNDVELRLKAGGDRAVVKGTVERVSMGKGGKRWLGTAVVLDDGTPVWLSYNQPPPGWEALLGKFVSVESQLSYQSSATVQSLHAPHLISPGTPTVIDRPLSSLLDRRVRLVGTADNAKGGAVLLVGDEPVYLDKHTSWPKEFEQQRVGVGGRLVRTKYLPEATTLEGGVISQGVEPGSHQFVLVDPSEPTAF